VSTSYFPNIKSRFIIVSFMISIPILWLRAAPADDKEKAVAVLEQAVKTNPNNSEIWVHLGFAYRKAEKIDQARDAFEKAASLNPQTTEAYYMLGLIYESQHNTAAAIKAWQNYLASEKDSEKRAIAQKHLHVLGQ
jgi:cytochrome c-type biogenesis protein CcmH/NrfG